MVKKGKAPGKHWRAGISLCELTGMFPDNDTAEVWLEEQRWGKGNKLMRCPHCDSKERLNARENKKPMPWHCGVCRKYFSVRTGTAMAESRLPLRKWVFAIFICTTSLKGISSMKLRRELGVTQKTAWFMLQRLRDSMKGFSPKFEGPVEADETFMGGLEKNKHSKKKLRRGRGGTGKTPVAGVHDRKTNKIIAKVVKDTTGDTLKGFVHDHTSEDAKVYTDEATAYKGLARHHETVVHSVGEFVREQAHTNGMESFWAALKRAHEGTFHHMSVKHLQRYVDEFACRHNIRDLDTIDMMRELVLRMEGKRLTYRELIA